MNFYKEFQLYEHLWDTPASTAKTRKTRKSLKESIDAAFDQATLKACLDRVTASALDEPELDEYGCSINVKVSEEDLKKALRIGSRGGYTNGSGVTMPAQLVDLLSLEIIKGEAGEAGEDDICTICLELYGENEETGETTHDYNDGDIPFVGDTSIPGKPIESDEEFFEYLKNEVFPKADSIAHDIINKTWNEFGFNDYAGITDYTPTETVTSIDSDSASDDWKDLLNQADKLLDELIKASGNTDYDDGDGYWESEYTKWCFRYLYSNYELNNVEELDRLCNEYSTKLPNVEFYFSGYEDEGTEVYEIGYIATKA
jgi:hypothetical protein